MANTERNIGALCVVLLAGCGGGSFGGSAATDGGAEPDGGRVTADALSAAGGTPADDAGGAGPGGRGAGGTAAGGGGTGGSVPSAGGALGATGGAPEAGGAPGGTGGAAPGTGGLVGSGGAPAPDAGPGCKPPVVDETNLPRTLVWESYLSKYGDTCLACAQSPCTTCTLDWFPVTQSADGLTVTAGLNKGTCGAMPLAMGPCGSALTGCTTWDPSVEATLTLKLEPKPDGSGYRVAELSGEQAHVAALPGTCPSVAFGQAKAAVPPYTALANAVVSALGAIEWPCG